MRANLHGPDAERHVRLHVLTRPGSLEALKAPALPPANGFYDDGIRAEAQFSMGFMKSSREWPVGSPSAFGAPGAGGSLAFADPETGIAFAYVTNRMSAKVLCSARDQALQRALASVLACRPRDECIGSIDAQRASQCAMRVHQSG
ncbi:MAG: hypothetical protein EOQ92_22640 [Mesorhizobium sp.]|uniref:serine hydrolase n=1 Tax=Mesorhizobium sp. TaxID=1871066 RepID=UPI000FE9B9D7|nr:serine hydrolase [Mesorhizobium sp.]RWI18578.1 MAG: hypothetical protein EOQ92_22640 [Mesorhizobium sp.]RWK46295.1 MAG: hypothetical protein EOR47_26850 [Mesorhizobium sp.]RWK93932.1 MAG: hypothetical protein EOR53_20970 [Mesorhizobium sp.]RWM17765.1 MAG: hypothetical protein EOR73_20015 [Mesorhizobium sp.]TIP55754.1 MAG: beta-lactamase family protein [Mesorhizobium sp.]